MNIITITHLATRNCIALLLLVSTLLLFTGCPPGDTGNANRIELANTVSGEPTGPPETELSITCTNPFRAWKDFSGSISSEILAKTSDNIIAAIRANRNTLCGIELVNFSVGNTLDTEQLPEQFFWGLPPQKEEFHPDFSHAAPEVKLFKDANKRFVDNQKRKFDENQKNIVAAYESRFSKELERFRLALTLPPQIASSCTHFFSVAERMRSEDLQRNLIVTDGWSDCLSEHGPVPEFKVSGKYAVVMIPRPSDTQQNLPEIAKRKEFIAKVFKGSGIYDVYQSGKAVISLF